MIRRDFLKTAAGASLACAAGGYTGAAEPAPPDMDELFEAGSPEVLALTRRVFDKCILDKLRAPQEIRQFSQIPILGWGVERVYRRNGDKELLRQCLGPRERFHDWYWRERDLRNNGLITVRAYAGKLQHAKWETFDYECNRDGLAAAIADKTVANALANGISERYDSVSGKGLGVPDYCMSCTLVTMMLDGLTQTHTLNERGTKTAT